MYLPDKHKILLRKIKKQKIVHRIQTYTHHVYDAYESHGFDMHIILDADISWLKSNGFIYDGKMGDLPPIMTPVGIMYEKCCWVHLTLKGLWLIHYEL